MAEFNQNQIAYGNLLFELMKASRREDVTQRDRILAAAELWRELWPDDVKTWEDFWSSDRVSTAPVPAVQAAPQAP